MTTRSMVSGSLGSSRAYVSLITSDSFQMGVEVLLYSLFVKAAVKDDVVLLFTPQVSLKVQKQIQERYPLCILREVKDIPNPNVSVSVAGWINSGYTKLHIWSLVEYMKVLYIDADALVLQSVEELFDRDSKFCAAPDVFPPDKFNAGVLLIQPDRKVFDDMMQKLTLLSSHDGGDTGFLNSYFDKWYYEDHNSRLPFGYNAQRTLHWMTYQKNEGYWKSIKPLKIIHYSSNPKPWDDATRKGDLELLWWQAYLESRLGQFSRNVEVLSCAEANG